MKTTDSTFVVSALCFGLLSSGCASLSVSDNASRGSPKIYGGTRLNIAALKNDETTLASFSHFGIRPPEQPGWDLPLSFVGDTVLLPYTVGYMLCEPFVGR